MGIINESKTLECLTSGEISVQGQIMWGSNQTLLTKIEYQQIEVQAVYKPKEGERPLWDFPTETLAGREVAAYLVSHSLGWDFVPPTAYREDGPMGPGSLQFFVEHDPNYHYFNFEDKDKNRLRRVALFDALINNTDRKGGHILIDLNERIWLIDHGICFHADPKLRTVVWDFAGQEISGKDAEDLAKFNDMLANDDNFQTKLSAYLNEDELDALSQRSSQLISQARYPYPSGKERSYPWPPV